MVFYNSSYNQFRAQSRIHSLIVMLGIFLGQFQYVPSLLYIILLECLYFGIVRLITNIVKSADKQRLKEYKTFLRKAALKRAAIFLSPYRDIWKHLRLSNKNCYIRLGETPSEIIAGEKVAPYRKFYVVTSYVHDYDDLWNMFCKSFWNNTDYAGLVELCDKFRVSIKEELSDKIPQRADSEYERSSNQFKPAKKLLDESALKLDINNCSEVELTELPGINIIMAKKIVRKREEINGFKSLQEFFKYANLKPHFQTQLKNRIEIKNKKGSLLQEKYSERNLDL